MSKLQNGGGMSSKQSELVASPDFIDPKEHPVKFLWHTIFWHRIFGAAMLTGLWMAVTSPIFGGQSIWTFLLNIWPYSEFSYFLIGSFILHEVLYFGFCGLTYYADRHGWWPQYKLPRTPGQKPKPELIRRTMLEAFFNHFVYQWFGLSVVYFSIQKTKFGAWSWPPLIENSKWSIFFSENGYATPLVVFFQFLISRCSLIIMFYWSHRMLHLPFFYQRVHKQHHEYTGTIGFASEYAHWFEQLFSNQIPSVLPVILLGAHASVFWIWLEWRLFETYETHSGFAFPGLLLHGDGAHYHDYHHTRNDGNYGDPIWDAIGGTTGSWMTRQRKLHAKA